MPRAPKFGKWKSSSGRVYEVRSCVACPGMTIGALLCGECWREYTGTRFYQNALRAAVTDKAARVAGIMRFATKKRMTSDVPCP